MRTMTLELDEDDYAAVQEALARRQGVRREGGGCLLPEGGGNLAGRLVAEICRGWVEMLDAWPEDGE